MAKIINALRALQVQDTRDVFRIETEVAAGVIGVTKAYGRFRFKLADGTTFAEKPDMHYHAAKEFADLSAGRQALLTSLKNSINRPDLFRMHIEIAEDNSFVFKGHCNAPTDVLSGQVIPVLTAQQITAINSLIAALDGE